MTHSVPTRRSSELLVHLLPAAIDDSEIHNLRSAFIAGLADGMGTTVAILQEGYDPVPIDYRDFVTVITHPAQIDEAIADLAGEVIQKFSEVDRSSESTDESILAKVQIGRAHV